MGPVPIVGRYVALLKHGKICCLPQARENVLKPTDDRTGFICFFTGPTNTKFATIGLRTSREFFKPIAEPCKYNSRSTTLSIVKCSICLSQVIVPIIGCNRPKHKPLYELVSDYNSQLSHHTNYRWFIPPAGQLYNLSCACAAMSTSW